MFPNLYPRKDWSGMLLHLAKLAFFLLNLALTSKVMPRFVCLNKNTYSQILTVALFAVSSQKMSTH